LKNLLKLFSPVTVFFGLRCLKLRKLLFISLLTVGAAELCSAKYESPFEACDNFQGSEAFKSALENCKQCGAGKPDPLLKLRNCDSANILQAVSGKDSGTGVPFQDTAALMAGLQASVLQKLEAQKAAAEKLVRCDGVNSMNKFCRDNYSFFANKIQEQWIPFRQAMALGPTTTIDHNVNVGFGSETQEDPCIQLNAKPKHFYGTGIATLDPLSQTEKCVAANKMLKRFDSEPLYQQHVRWSCINRTDPSQRVNPYQTRTINRDKVRAERARLHGESLQAYHRTIAEVPLIVYLEGMKISETSGPSCDLKKLQAEKPTPAQLAKAAKKLLTDINGQIQRFKNNPNSLELLDYKAEVNAVLKQNQSLCPAAELAQNAYDRKNMIEKNSRKNESEREKQISLRASVVSGLTCVTAPEYCIAATVATAAVAGHTAYTHYKALKNHENNQFQVALTVGNLELAENAKKETNEAVNAGIGNTIKSAAIGFGAGAAGGIAIKQAAKTKTFKKVASKASGLVDDGIEAINKILSHPTVVAVTKEFKLNRSEQELVAKMYAKLNLATDGQVEEKIRKALLTCSN